MSVSGVDGDAVMDIRGELTIDEEYALYEYSQCGAYAVNAYLHHHDDMVSRASRTIMSAHDAQRLIRGLDAALSKCVLPHALMVYRSELVSMTSGEYRAIRSCLGGDYVDAAYMSTTLVRDDDCRYAIEIPGGTHGICMHGYSAHPEEMEILLPRNSSYRVKEVSRDGLIRMVHMGDA